MKNFNIKWILALTFISVIWVNLNHERWKSKDVITHDIMNYNSYLPALFYEKDLLLSFLADTINQNIESRLYSPNHTPQGKPVIKMSMGMAITYFPFFILAHIYSKIFDYPANGFSEPYHFAILFSSLFYYLIGLLFLWKILRYYFSEAISSLTLICLTFGTNVFAYLTLGAGMAHPINFSLTAIFLFYTLQWHQHPGIRTAVLIGCVGGFLTLVRPINILVFIFFFLYDIKSLAEVTAKIKWLNSYKFHLLTIFLFVFLIFTPQLIYWKYVTGQFLFNSYVGEHFYFNKPHIFKALFGFRKGWLIYTPIMLFSLGGFFLLRDELKKFKLALTVFLLVYLYVAFSWWCWWYGGSFGQRGLIDIYPLLAIPFGAFLLKVETQTILVKKCVYSLLTFFILLNLFQTMQAKYNIIHYDSMTRKNYFEVFFTTTKKPDREKYLKHPDYQKAMKGEDEE